MKSVLIFASSNTVGNTAEVCNLLTESTDIKVINLNNYQILPFNYGVEEQSDDFIPLMIDILEYDCLIFASPVYWYAPCGQMKTFIDRFSDLLHHHKTLGRRLRTKSAAVIATGADDTPQVCFEQMFVNTFNYLGMNYRGMLYVSHGKNDLAKQEHINLISAFKSQLGCA